MKRRKLPLLALSMALFISAASGQIPEWNEKYATDSETNQTSNETEKGLTKTLTQTMENQVSDQGTERNWQRPGNGSD